MSAFALPTTAGSIISFDGWEDLDKTTKFRYVITLVPGGYDTKNNVFTDVVWMDMYAEEGGIYNIPEEEILAGNPKVIFEAPAPAFTKATVETFDGDEVREYGSILLLDSIVYGDDAVAVFTPGALDLTHEVIIEGAWTNSYGTFFTQDEVEVEAKAILVMGTTESI
jgi:hypothetical protein